MLNAKENMYEAVFGGKPERYVNQYEAVTLLPHPMFMTDASPKRGGEDTVNAWGITLSFPEYTPGVFPVHTNGKTVIKDIEHWRDYVKAPSLEFPKEIWDTCKGIYDEVDKEKSYKATLIVNGIFEKVHYLCSIDEALINYIEYPDEMHELIDYITNWELEMAKDICKNLHPNAIFHHDDWGTEISSFLSPEMFREFFLLPYQKLYKYYHEHGVELVIHHCDSYAANLVPTMIDMGIDVWQGCMSSNDVPSLVKQYGDKITFMGEIDNKLVDRDNFTDSDADEIVEKVFGKIDKLHFIPCITQGGPGSIYPGSYRKLWDAIDRANFKKFGFSLEQIESARLPFSEFVFG